MPSFAECKYPQAEKGDIIILKSETWKVSSLVLKMLVGSAPFEYVVEYRWCYLSIWQHTAENFFQNNWNELLIPSRKQKPSRKAKKQNLLSGQSSKTITEIWAVNIKERMMWFLIYLDVTPPPSMFNIVSAEMHWTPPKQQWICGNRSSIQESLSITAVIMSLGPTQ